MWQEEAENRAAQRACAETPCGAPFIPPLPLKRRGILKGFLVINTPRGDVTIRPTREADAVAFRDLRLEALRTHPEVFGADYDENLARPIEFWQERVRDGAGSDLGITYVAEPSSPLGPGAGGGALVAMTGIYRDNHRKMRHSGMIWGVYVLPEWRGGGIAGALIGACVGWSREHGLRLVKLSVVTTNAAAIRRYVRCGFSVYGVEPEVIYHDSIYYDELLMIRRLTPDTEIGRPGDTEM
jgi:RimJ/RimL family protein N-acetyltransferase